MNTQDIKKLRQSLGLSQDRFAFLLGVAPYTVRRWESGTSTPSQLAQRQITRLERKARG